MKTLEQPPSLVTPTLVGWHYSTLVSTLQTNSAVEREREREDVNKRSTNEKKREREREEELSWKFLETWRGNNPKK